MESEWDDRQRDLMLGLTQYESEVCACGWHESLIPDGHFAIEEDSCPVCAAGDRYARIRADADAKWRKALGDEPPADRHDIADGRKARTRMKRPDEIQPQPQGADTTSQRS